MPSVEKQFTIDVEKISWLEGLENDPGDCCAHGRAVARIGGEVLEYDCTVSATALYLLKSLEENHRAYREEQFLPCCGHFIIEKEDDSGDVVICGCPNGVDWDLRHEGDHVTLVTDADTQVAISIAEYREEVFRFADKVEAFYASQPPRKLSDDQASAYRALWEEWHRRRKA